MKRNIIGLVLPLLILIFLLSACQHVAESEITYDAANLQFSGEQALALEDSFVTQFPNRDSGMPNIELGTQWLQEQFESYGLTCTTDSWQTTNFSKTYPLKNVICRLPGTSEREILLFAHHDQSAQTVFGANNDGSGIAIILHLAQLFATETPGPYTLIFLADDGEETGMLGSRRYIEQHPDPQFIVAAISIDNAGKFLYDRLELSPIGQFDGYGPAWLLQAARDSAAAAQKAGDNTIFVPRIRAPIDQVIDQAVPISFMDQGPLVAAGVPALGFTGGNSPEYEELHYESYHSPIDTMEMQSADTLQSIGRAAEALIRHVQTIESFPQSSTPYLFFADNNALLAGPILWLIIALFVALFFITAIFLGRRSPDGLVVGWRAAMPHFLGLWLPLVLSVLSLYALTAVGLLQKFDRYFAYPKHPAYYNPRWPAVFLFLAGLVLFLYVGRRLAARYQTTQPTYASVKSLAFLVIGIAALYGAVFNAFSLLLTIPLFFWLLIRDRHGLPFLLDILFFILGSSLLWYLLYTFGFVVLRIDWLILWYIMMMIAVPMVGFFTMAVITAITAAGFSLLVHAPALQTKTVDAPAGVAVADEA